MLHVATPQSTTLVVLVVMTVPSGLVTVFLVVVLVHLGRYSAMIGPGLDYDRIRLEHATYMVVYKGF